MSISARAILLGLVAVALVVFIVSWAELVTGQIMIGFLQLPPVVLALLFLLALVNRLLARWGQRWSLRPQELAVIHVMMLIAAMVSSRGLMEKLIPTLVGQNYYADSTNKWASLYFPFVKKWLVPWVPALGEKQWVAVRFFEGLRSWEHVPWLAWAVPLAAWSVPVVAMLFAYLCLATILRRQWTENERLSYPLAQLPLELIRERDESSFLLNRAFWIGFLIPALLFTANGLHNMFPAIPSVTTSVDVKQYLTQPPWNTVEYFVAYFSPAAVGFFFLLPTDLLFSLWFFFALGKVQEAGFASLGMVPETGPHAGARIPVAGQATGAWFALAIYLVFVSWPHLKRVWKAAVTGDRKESEGELLSYRTAVFGLFLAFVAIVVWTVAAGMSPWLALFEFGVFLFVQALIMARSTAEAGMLMTEGTFTPLDLVSAGIARSSLGGANLTTFAFLDAMFTRDLRGLMLTGFLDGQRVADGAGLQRRKLLGVFALAIVTSILLAGALQLWLPYHRGAINMYSYTYRGNDIQFFRENAPALQGPVPIRLDYLGWIAGGMVVTAFLGWMRMRYFWWPLHPLGYALATTWTVLVFWCPILVAWICKASISRYGGMRAYQRARPFFLGMVFGEFITAVVWTLIAMSTNAPAPAFPWP